MANDEKKEKVILKRSALPGVDMSIVDLELVSTVKIRVTIVKKLIYKIKGQTFIGTRDQLDDMDVIQVGSLRLKYRVMKLVKMTDREGYIYRIKRIDGALTTGVDIESVALGHKVSIVNRPTFDDLFNYACSLKEEVCDPVTIDLCDTGACDKPKAITQSIAPAVDCDYVRIAIPAATGGTTTYFNCAGEVTVENHSSHKTPYEVFICAQQDQPITSVGTITVIPGGCP